MPRVKINGVVWCNVQDEILKKAVEKYGKNRWHLIISCLSGKTEEQCKARWASALDPSVERNRTRCGIEFESLKSPNGNLNHSSFYNTQRKMSTRFNRERLIARTRRLKNRELAMHRLRITATPMGNNSSNVSSSSIYAVTTKHGAHSEDKVSRWIDQHLDSEYVKNREDMQRLKRRVENNNNNTIGSLDSNVTLSKRAKVVVQPVPQHSIDELYDFRDEQCRPGFESNRPYRTVE